MRKVKKLNFNKIFFLAAKVKNGGQTSRWRQMNVFYIENRRERRLSGNSSTLFQLRYWLEKRLRFKIRTRNPRWRQNPK
jgi:hypothetical protein